LHLIALSFLAVRCPLWRCKRPRSPTDRLRLAMAREATVLLVMGNLAIAAASAEEASFSPIGAFRRGAEAFTDEGDRKPSAGAAVLVRSRIVTERLCFASRRRRVAPRDVVVAPFPLLGDPASRSVSCGRSPAPTNAPRRRARRPDQGKRRSPSSPMRGPRWSSSIALGSSHRLAPRGRSTVATLAPEPLGPRIPQGGLRRPLGPLRARPRNEHGGRTGRPVDGVRPRARLKDGVAAAAALATARMRIVLLERLGKVRAGTASWPS